MKLAASLSMVIAILICSPATGGMVVHSGGRLVQWIPNSEIAEAVSAAFNPNGIPIVLYSPERLGSLNPIAARFLLLRQEYVALLARKALRSQSTPRGTFRNQGSFGQMEQIREQEIYRFMPPNADYPRTIDCIAFHSMNNLEKRSLILAAQGGQRGGPLRVWPTDHIVTAEDLEAMDDRSCESGLSEYQ